MPRGHGKKRVVVGSGLGLDTLPRYGFTCRVIGDTLLVPYTRCRHILRIRGITRVTRGFSRCITGRPGIDFQSKHFCVFSKRGAMRTHQAYGNNVRLPIHYGIFCNLAGRSRTALFTVRANGTAYLATNRHLHTGLITRGPSTLCFIKVASGTNIRFTCSNVQTP